MANFTKKLIRANNCKVAKDGLNGHMVTRNMFTQKCIEVTCAFGENRHRKCAIFTSAHQH